MQLKVRLKKFIPRDGDTALKEYNEGVVFWDEEHNTYAIYIHGHAWQHIQAEYQKTRPDMAKALVTHLAYRKKHRKPINDLIVTFETCAEHTMAQVMDFDLVDEETPEPKKAKVKVDPAVYLAIEGFGLF